LRRTHFASSCATRRCNDHITSRIQWRTHPVRKGAVGASAVAVPPAAVLATYPPPCRRRSHTSLRVRYLHQSHLNTENGVGRGVAARGGWFVRISGPDFLRSIKVVFMPTFNTCIYLFLRISSFIGLAITIGMIDRCT